MKMKFRTRLCLLIVLTLLLITMTSFAVGKYIQDFGIGEQQSVAFTEKLANSIEIRETPAVLQSSGEYKLEGTAAKSNGVTYNLIPGLDIPKDSYVVVDKDSTIPAKLYINIECTNAAVTFTVDGTNWKQVGTTNEWVYAPNGTEKVITSDLTTSHIFLNDLLYVSDKLLSSAESATITITAKLVEEQPTT